MDPSRRDFIAGVCVSLAASRLPELASGAEAIVRPDANAVTKSALEIKYAELFKPRIWATDTEAFDASLLCSDERFVVLAAVDGSIQTVPINKLSKTDRLLLGPFNNETVDQGIVRVYEGGSALSFPDRSTRFYKFPEPLHPTFNTADALGALERILPPDKFPNTLVLREVGVLMVYASEDVHKRICELLPTFHLTPASPPPNPIGAPVIKKLQEVLRTEIAVNFAGVTLGTAVGVLRQLADFDITLHNDNFKKAVDGIPLKLPPERTRLDTLLGKLAAAVDCSWSATADGKQVIIAGSREICKLGISSSYAIPAPLQRMANGILDFISMNTGKNSAEMAFLNGDRRSVRLTAHPSTHREISELLMWYVAPEFREGLSNARRTRNSSQSRK